MSDDAEVLSGLSSRVVDALLDDEGATADPFTLAAQRYREEGAPREPVAPWRRQPSARALQRSRRAVDVLRRLNRDLLERITAEREVSEAEEGEGAAEETPANVRPIGSAFREMPALELASDGAWRPAGGPAKDAADQVTRHHAHVPAFVSRYPTRASAPFGTPPRSSE